MNHDCNFCSKGSICTSACIEDNYMILWLAKTKFVELSIHNTSDTQHRVSWEHEIVVRPSVVDINGLYILIIENDGKCVPKELTSDLVTCMRFLRSLTKERQKVMRWNWSPLFQICEKWPPKNLQCWSLGLQSVWVGGDIRGAFGKHKKNNSFSLEHECPHILRAISYLIRIFKEHKCPFAHPTKCLRV